MADINLTAAEVAQLILSIGNAAALSTKDKTSLVAAINEVASVADKALKPEAYNVAYSGTVDGTNVTDVRAALDALSEMEAVFVVSATQDSSGTVTSSNTYAEISAEVSKKKPVACFLQTYPFGTAVLWLESFSAAAAIFRLTYVTSGNYTQTVQLKVTSENVWSLETLKETPDGIGAVPKSRTVNGKSLTENVTLAAEDIGYPGKVGDAGSSPNTVSNVAEALVALAVGEPFNVTANFVDSGAASVAEWAVAGSGDYYNIGEGYYIIATTDTRYYVRILGLASMTQRVVQIWKYGRVNIEPTFEIWQCTAPGATPEMLLRYEADRGDLTIPNQRWDWQVPDYRGKPDGSVLAMRNGHPVWMAISELTT